MQIVSTQRKSHPRNSPNVRNYEVAHCVGFKMLFVNENQSLKTTYLKKMFRIQSKGINTEKQDREKI